MLNQLRLAWAHACHHRLQTTLLLLCISLTFYLPLTTHRLVHTFHGRLTARAHFTGATPLVIGAKGSRFDLVLHALNFRRLPGDNLRARELDWLRDTKLANIIPLYSRDTVRQRGGRFPIVGTTLDYLEFRKLRHATGRPFALLGECVLGANAAARLRRGPGDAVLSDPGNFIDLSRQPLRLTITGVLAHTGTADDDAVFVDLKTAWIIAGHGHGHDDESANPGVLLNREGNRTVYNAALEQAIEITSKNLHTFHFHGEHGDLPLTAILALPHDERASALLEGKAPFQLPDSPIQALAPDDVIGRLMDLVFQIKQFIDANFLLVGFSAALFLALVVMLSLRLRRVERETMALMGCSRGVIFWLQTWELLMVLAASVLLAWAGAWATAGWLENVLRGSGL
ncbi:MAG: ABC transporter permease [Verrucomicrobiota bacterium]|nr:ABC transporter permease [Verrucomicrobiota bacterium]